MKQNQTYHQGGASIMRTLRLQLLKICIVARYLNLSKNICKKTFQNFRPKNPTISNTESSVISARWIFKMI